MKEDALKLVIGNLKSHNHKPKLNQCHQSSLARVENEKILLFPMFRKSTNTKENLIPNQKLLKKANCGQARTPSVSTKPLQNLKGGKVQDIQKSTVKESQPITGSRANQDLGKSSDWLAGEIVGPIGSKNRIFTENSRNFIANPAPV